MKRGVLIVIGSLITGFAAGLSAQDMIGGFLCGFLFAVTVCLSFLKGWLLKKAQIKK